MRKSPAILWLLPLLAVAGGAACGRSETSAAAEPAASVESSPAPESPTPEPAPQSGFAAPLPSHAPSAQPQGELPAGHPPLGAAGGEGAPVMAAAEGGVGAQALVWAKPQGWVEEPPNSGMRRAQYKIPGSDGAAECVVYYFGPGQGGDAESNAKRWADQFEQPDGRPSSEVMKRTEMKANGISILMVEVTGSYAGGMGSTPKSGGTQAKQLLLGAIAAGPDANWFFKLLGPEGTVRAQEGAFKAMLGSLKPGS